MSRFQFIETHHRAHGVKRLCLVLEVARSSFYKWRAAREAHAARKLADEQLAELIRAIHAASGGTYGAPRITAELRQAHGMEINEKRVARVMRAFEITGFRLRRRKSTTIPDPEASTIPTCCAGTSPPTRRTASTWATSPTCRSATGSSSTWPQ